MLNYRKYYKKQCRLDLESMIRNIEHNVKIGVYSREYADQLINNVKNTHDESFNINRT